MRDIILAQHEANLYSYVLSEQYGKDGKTRDFPLPGVNISDIEMTLRYAVLDNVDNSEQYYITYDKLTKFMNGLCDAVAQKTIAIMENYILTNGLQTPKGQDFFDKIKKKGEVYQYYQKFIVRKLRASYDGTIHELINNRTGILDEAEIVKRLKDTVSQDIINDRDNMSKLFNDTDGKNTKALEDRVTAEIGTIVKKNCQKKRDDDSEGDLDQRVLDGIPERLPCFSFCKDLLIVCGTDKDIALAEISCLKEGLINRLKDRIKVQDNQADHRGCDKQPCPALLILLFRRHPFLIHCVAPFSF